MATYIQNPRLIVNKKGGSGRRRDSGTAREDIYQPKFEPMPEDQKRVYAWMQENKENVPSWWWQEITDEYWGKWSEWINYLESLCPECLSDEGKYYSDHEVCTFCINQ